MTIVQIERLLGTLAEAVLAHSQMLNELQQAVMQQAPNYPGRDDAVAKLQSLQERHGGHERVLTADKRKTFQRGWWYLALCWKFFRYRTRSRPGNSISTS